MGDASTIDDYLWPNKYLLTIHGFWPMDHGKHAAFSRLSVYLRIVSSIFFISGVFVPQMFKIIVCWGDLAVLTGVGCVMTTLGQLLFKLLYVLARRRSFHLMYVTTRELWSTVTDHDEREGLEALAGFAKQLSFVCISLGISNNISFVMTSAISWIKYNAETNGSLHERILPVDAWYGSNMQHTPNFEIIFGFQFIACIYCSTGIVAFDTIMMSLILHVCGHFRVIAERLRTIGQRMEVDEAYSKSDQSKRAPLAREEIGLVIEQHRRMLRLAEEMRNLLSPVIFMQLVTSGLEICLSSYTLIVNSSNGNTNELMKGIVYVLAMFLQLVVWCWPGQLLIQNSQDLGDVVCYEMPWYLLTPRQQRDLDFLITRTQKECRITALGFQVMSMRKFTEVFNTAGSYFALLRSIYEKQMEEQQ